MTPDQRAEYARRYYAEHRDELNAYKAEWARTQRRLNTESAQRARIRARERRREQQEVTSRRRSRWMKAEAMAAASFTLHALSCPYPARGCDCRVLVVTSVEATEVTTDTFVAERDALASKLIEQGHAANLIEAMALTHDREALDRIFPPEHADD